MVALISFKVCPDDTTPSDTTEDGAFESELVGDDAGAPTDGAFINPFEDTLELCNDNVLQLTTLCPGGVAIIMSFKVDVMYVSKVTVTFVIPAGTDVVMEVNLFFSNYTIRFFIVLGSFVLM